MSKKKVRSRKSARQSAAKELKVSRKLAESGILRKAMDRVAPRNRWHITKEQRERLNELDQLYRSGKIKVWYEGDNY